MAFVVPLVPRNKCFVTADTIKRFPGESRGLSCGGTGSGQMGPGFRRDSGPRMAMSAKI
jgi:hypothetical protein